MKLILTGSTGFIGAEVLRQCLNNPSITSLIALTRRPIPTTHPKLQTVLLDDFASYSPAVLRQLAGADACIWALGVKTSNAETQKRVTIDYTVAAMTAFATLRAPTPQQPARPPFRLVFTSGILAVRKQSETLWFGSEARKIKGEVETLLLDFEREHAHALQAFVVRPGAVLAHDGLLGGLAAGLGAPAVSVQGLAAVMIDVAVGGRADGERVFENRELVVKGRELLKATEKK